MPHPRRSRFCWLRRASLPLLLGLGTTVAVAWAAEVWSRQRVARGDPLIDGSEEWFVEVPSRWPTAPGWVKAEGGNGRTVTSAMYVDSGGLYGFGIWRQEEVRAGLPLRAFRRVDVTDPPARQTDDALHLSRLQTGLPLPSWLGVDPSEDRRLPLLPLWPGLAVNTLCYGLLWWLGLAARHMVICNRRFRRGLCPVCRYDLGFNNTPGCPECGWRRT